MGMNYLTDALLPATQMEQADPRQVQNSAGGYTFQVDDWQRLDRFLILGSEGGTYYATERKLTRENAQVVDKLAQQDGLRLVKRIVEISEAGRAPKNDPAILALAIAARAPDVATRQAAYAALPKVCRIGTHLYHFAAFMQANGGWGRGLRRAVAKWFTDKSADDAAFQILKYQQRDGWSAKDLLKLSHAKPPTAEHDALFRWVAKGETQEHRVALVDAYSSMVTATDVKDVVKLIREHKMPREMVPTQWHDQPSVWEALLPNLGLTALIRNLATLTRMGLLNPFTQTLSETTARITDEAAIKKARVHPIAMLIALKTYAQGRGVKGDNTWNPVQQVVDALDAGFYAAFQHVEPTNKRTLLAIDVSGSMEMGHIAGAPGLTPRQAAAAMAMVTARAEPNHHFLGFSNRLVDIPISKHHRLDEVCQIMARIPMGGTDCSLPFQWAQQTKAQVDSYAVYTDNETWSGHTHPHKALQSYRKSSGIPAKSAVIGLTATNFTIADPFDVGMMDLVGFDAAAPTLMADFFRGPVDDRGAAS